MPKRIGLIQIDWIYTLENAAKLFLIDSCFSNLLEQLNFTNEKYFLLRSEIFFTPAMKNNRAFMGVPQDSLKVQTK